MNSSNTQISLHNIHLKLSTTAWNEAHDRLSVLFLRRRNVRLKRIVKGFYDFGTVLAILGMCGGVVGLGWMVFIGLEDVLAPKTSSPSGPITQKVYKRDVLEGAEVGGRTGSGGVTLIIPGVTVPLSDLPVIIASVFISQVVHEFGHAAAAALDSIPLISSGASLTLIIPSAFVSFSTSSLASLQPSAKARIIAAGPFHNLVTWGFLTAARMTGIGGWVRSVGYMDVSRTGRGVVSVETDSPLYGYLKPDESVVTALDDEPLNVEHDTWSQYLLKSQPETGKKGWCVQKDNLEPTASCCLPGKGNETNACIRDLQDDHAPLGCLNPFGLFTNITAPRCTVSDHCGDERACGVFDRKLGILRIRAREGLEGREKVLLWSGPRQEVWEQVSVSRWRGRLGVLKSGYLNFIVNFQSYMEMTALSLFVFNLLPIWHLDGMQLLSTLLSLGIVAGSAAYADPESQRGGGGERARWSTRTSKAVSGSVGALMCLNLLLQIYHLL
ncbi:hypothetical protein BKA70DRAFT_1109670 [Coprinopsis sp. MPI-PUGE-AT-0042]|nr:hypothetical protein BKA70DRAFT_1109670 [Coprinopsis sp. MPI-PUGE-AT-0042]